MEIKVNGRIKLIECSVSIEEFVKGNNFCAQSLVIEHNFKIIPKNEWQNVFLKEGDNLEIVSFVSGG